MMESLQLQSTANTELSFWAGQAHEYIVQSKAQNTIRAYRSGWASFTSWCRSNSLESLPATPTTVALYIAAQASDHKVATLQQRISAISQAHQAAGHESPTRSLQVRLVLQGARRLKGTASAQKAPAVVNDLRQMVEKIPDTIQGQRDRALLLVGFASACRRSEMVALDAEDLEWGANGVIITIRRSKTDQEGLGRKVAIPYGSRSETCPVKSLREWLDSAKITEGTIFRSVDRSGNVLGRLTAQSVALIVKKYAELVGLDPSKYAGHSLRAGMVTSAAAAGVDERVIAKQTGHQSMLVLRRYIREGDLFRSNAAAGIGL